MPTRSLPRTTHGVAYGPAARPVLVRLALLVAGLGWLVAASPAQVSAEGLAAEATGPGRLRVLSVPNQPLAAVPDPAKPAAAARPSSASPIRVTTGLEPDFGARSQESPEESRSPHPLEAIAGPDDDAPMPIAEAGPRPDPSDCGCGAFPEVCEPLADEGAWPGPCGDGPECLPASWPLTGLWLRAEYLMWWTKGSDIPALVTTSPVGTSPELSGVLGEPGTATLLGDDAVTGGLRSGGRFGFGYWTSPCQCLGIEANYLFLGTGTTRYRADSGAVAILARPYFDTALGAQSALLVAHPDFLAGSAAVDAISDFQAAEVLLRRAFFQRYDDRLEFLAGYRFARLDDELAIHQFSQWTQPQGIIPAGTTKDIADFFDTTNQFHGGQFGFAYLRRSGPWSLHLLAKMAVGNTRSRVRIDGRTLTTLPDGPSASFEGGLLAQATNIGTYQQDHFSIVPELGVTLGYEITRRLRATFGYTFLYWNRVARPGDQIDQNLAQLPPEPPVPGGGPRFVFRTASFWAQGMNFGLEYRF